MIIFFEQNKYLIFFIEIYLIIGLVLLPFYQYQINLDGISYISIAQKLATGHFQDAVNGYWGPLYSWLLVPMLLLNISPLIAVKILALFIGVGVFFIMNKLLDEVETLKRVKYLLFLALAVILIYFGYIVTTPDFLLAFLILAYLLVILDKRYLVSLRAIFLCGILGAVLYLTKQYALYFFVGSFLLFNFLFFVYGKISLKDALRNCLIGLLVCFLICSVWISLISAKYGYLTLGTSNRYNRAVYAPYSKGHPINLNNLIEPPNLTATSIWEDPSNLKLESWSPIDSFSAVKYQMFLIRQNIFKTINFMVLFSALFIWVLIQSFFSLISKRNLKITVLLTAGFIYIVGYLTLVIQERYLFTIYLILTVIAGYLLSEFFNRIRSSFFKNFFLTLCLIFLTASPLLELYKNLNVDKRYNQIAQVLNSNLELKDKRIVTDTYGDPTLLIAFQTNSKYIGQTGNYEDKKLLQSLLKQNQIDYYFAWDKENRLEVIYSDLLTDKIPEFRVFKVK